MKQKLPWLIIAGLLLIAAHPYPPDFPYLPEYDRHIQLDADLRGNPAAQPTADLDPGDHAGCLTVNNNNEVFYLTYEVGSDYVKGKKHFLEIDWFPLDAVVPANGNVIFQGECCLIAEGELIDCPIPLSIQGIYFADPLRSTPISTTIHTPLQIVGADHEDHVYCKMNRDMTNDSYTGDVCMTAYEVVYKSNRVPTH